MQDVAAPILGADGTTVRGVVLIGCDPDELFSLVQTWPIVSDSAESFSHAAMERRFFF